MERFCSSCGSLVSGDGKFCPTCGAPLESAVNLEKQPSETASQQPQTPYGVPVNNTYSGTSSNQGQIPAYPTSYNAVPSDQGEMTVGQWVLTIFLSSLGMIGIILLFIWAFSDTTPPTKKNYARAMLIWSAVVIAASIFFFLSSASCFGLMFEDLFDEFALIVPRMR